MGSILRRRDRWTMPEVWESLPMTHEEQTVLMIRGSIASLPAEDQAKVKTCMDTLTAMCNEHKDFAYLAIALVGAELQWKNS